MIFHLPLTARILPLSTFLLARLSDASDHPPLQRPRQCHPHRLHRLTSSCPPLPPAPSGATMLPEYPTAMASGGHEEGSDAVSA